jgi:hypothetical protein
LYLSWDNALRRYFSSIEPLLSVNGAEHAATLDGKCNEAHTDLIRHHDMSPVATNAELYYVYRIWKSPRRCFEATFQLNLAAFYP